VKVVLSILNYNGRHHLKYLLPTALDAVRQYGPDARVMILDNRSTNSDPDWITKNYPEIEVLISPVNDFLFSYNWYVSQISEEIVIFLNNDLRLDPGFIAPLISHFTSPDVFAVSAASWDWEGKVKTSGPSRLRFQNGFYNWSYDTSRQELCHTLFTSGGFMAVDRRKFIELGGFNRLYYPAYCEDLDLCFRAWRKGWRSIYDPSSIVWHREHASWTSSGHEKTDILSLRSSLLFQWSSLPLKKNRLIRYWSISRLIAGGLITRNRLWSIEFPKTLILWMKIRKNGNATKINEDDLECLNQQIDKAV
jgi:GT2 family glycosyltransferase